MASFPNPFPVHPEPDNRVITTTAWAANAPTLAATTRKVGPRIIRRYGAMLTAASPALATAVVERAATDPECRRLRDSPGEGEGCALALAVCLVLGEEPSLFDPDRLGDARLADLARADLRQPGGFIAGLIARRDEAAGQTR